MVVRTDNFKEVELNIVGSSVFGRYPKISSEKTYNMFISDNFMVPYAGYGISIDFSKFDNAKTGRGIFTSTKFGKLVLVFDDTVWFATITYNQQMEKVQFSQIVPIGTLQTSFGVVYITENNKPQILISDNTTLYIYDPSVSQTVQPVLNLDFQPGYITFHDTYFIAAATVDDGGNTNTWRLSDQNEGLTWPSLAANVGTLQTKPDKIKAVVRFPSKGNMILVMGSIVTEAWFDTGAQLFPYQRQNQLNIDYGCVSASTVAYMDQIVVWLAQNEKSGPIIMYTDGGMPKKITTDGIDYLFSQLQNPEDSQAFLYRQDGHLFYHINFYSDNLSLYYDFQSDKFYHACDQNLDYFIASEISFFNNQYYFVSRNNGNLFSFDTQFTTYQDTHPNGVKFVSEIPRIRSCKNFRKADQNYFIANDLGFTIETGETDYYNQTTGDITFITQDGNPLITQGSFINFITQNNEYLVTQDNINLSSQQSDVEGFSFLAAQQQQIIYTTPRVDLSISGDGGASFGNAMPYVLNAVGQRRNRLMWWQLGMHNDFVPQFKFWGFGRFVITNGTVNIRS